MEEHSIKEIFKISHKSLFGDKKAPIKFTIQLGIANNIFFYTDNCTAKKNWYRKAEYNGLYKHTADSYKIELEHMLSEISKFERDYRLNLLDLT